MATAWAPGNGQAFYHLQLVRPKKKNFSVVVDPFLLNPDPAFQVNPDPRLFDDKNVRKKIQLINFLKSFLIKNCSP